MSQDKIQSIIDNPATGIIVGSGTVGYGWLIEIANIAEAVGMIVGAALTIGLFIRFLCKEYRVYKRFINKEK